MIQHREDLDVEPLYQLAFGKRPREELYHLSSDPAYMKNLAAEPEHEAVRAELQVRTSESSANATRSGRFE
jgi:N-sulfoglucosamine sulfohydrolase